jgi:hypothetical protein
VKSQTATDNETGQRKLAVKKKKKKKNEVPNRTMPKFANEKSHGSQQNWETSEENAIKYQKKKKKIVIRLMKTTETGVWL